LYFGEKIPVWRIKTLSKLRAPVNIRLARTTRFPTALAQ